MSQRKLETMLSYCPRHDEPEDLEAGFVCPSCQAEASVSLAPPSFPPLFGVSALLLASFLVLWTLAVPAWGDAGSFYKDRMIPGSNVPCCTERDCKSLDKWRQKWDGDYEIFLDGVWYTPAQRIVRHDLTPDGRAHVCYRLQVFRRREPSRVK